jgi:hypothetical protein
MKKIVFILATIILGVSNITANEIDTEQLSPNIHFGFEISELLQNNFNNLGIKNFTLFLGQRFWKKGFEDFGYRILFINVELSTEHLSNNPFIKDEKMGLGGNLTVGRLYFDWYPVEKKIYFMELKPVLGIGIGYTRTVISNNEIYDLKSFSLSANFRVQYEFFRKLFIEFPVGDGFVYLWKNRSAKGTIENTIIDYPESGMVFLWINLGINIRF